MLYSANHVYHVVTFVASASGNYAAFAQETIGIPSNDKYASINYLFLHFSASRRFYCDIRVSNITIADVSTSAGGAGTNITLYY